VPVRAAIAGEPGSLLSIRRFAERDPVAWGTNLTTIWQLAPSAISPPQFDAPTKKSSGSLPPNIQPVTINGSTPSLVTVTVLPAPVVPSGCVPANASAVGLARAVAPIW
jgi:hypothetical protein